MGQRQEGPPRPPGHRERSSGAGGGRQGADGGGQKGGHSGKGGVPSPSLGTGVSSPRVSFFTCSAQTSPPPPAPPHVRG